MINRTQALVLAFLALAWVSLVVILVVAPEIYDAALPLAIEPAVTRLAFLVAISAFIFLLAVGVVRRWRWTFWLILVGFLFGVLRVPTSLLQWIGTLPAAGPAWYVAYQALLGLAQFAIGLSMLAAYRRGGVWGSA